MGDQDFFDIMDIFDIYVQIPRIITDACNPLELYTDEQFRKRYRFTKNSVRHHIMPLVEPGLRKDPRGHPAPPILMLLTALRFYATGMQQYNNGDIHYVTQGSVSRICAKVSSLICEHVGEFIKFPDNLAEVTRNFYKFHKFPGVIGCIDCTHVPINCPQVEIGEHFRNRKGTFSLNVQVTGGPNLEIFDIVCRWPGSAHDSRIFHNSALKYRLEEGTLHGLILGDSGYPQLPYLYTPFLRPERDHEHRYNRSHIHTRNSIERLFGVWKKKFPCLSKKFQTKLENTVKTIVATAVLHNIGVQLNDLLDDYGDRNPVVYEQPPPVQIANGNHFQGNVLKQNFAYQHFRR